MEFEATGPKGRGIVVVEGKKLGKDWSVTHLELRPDGGGDHLMLTADLEASTGTDTPKFDPAVASSPSAKPAPPPPAEIEIALPPGGLSANGRAHAGAVDLQTAVGHGFDQLGDHIGTHAVVQAPAGQDDFGVVAN
jgi:hypothetical protein